MGVNCPLHNKLSIPRLAVWHKCKTTVKNTKGSCKNMWKKSLEKAPVCLVPAAGARRVSVSPPILGCMGNTCVFTSNLQASRRPAGGIRWPGIQAGLPGKRRVCADAQRIRKYVRACEPRVCAWDITKWPSVSTSQRGGRGPGWLGLCCVWVQYVGAASGTALSGAIHAITYVSVLRVCVCVSLFVSLGNVLCFVTGWSCNWESGSQGRETQSQAPAWASATGQQEPGLEQLEEAITFLTSLNSIMAPAVAVFSYIKWLTAARRQTHKSSDRRIYLC